MEINEDGKINMFQTFIKEGLRNDNSGLFIPKEFLHLFSIKLKSFDVKTCDWCGNDFIATHGSQRFCPRKENRKRSSCEMAHQNYKRGKIK